MQLRMSTKITSSEGTEIPWLTRTFRIGCILIAVEGACFLLFSFLQAQHFNLQQDFAQFGQAWYKIAHLNFESVVTFKHRPFYADHGDFFFYLFAPFWYVWPHVVSLMWLQDLFATLAQLVALRWLHEYLASRPSSIKDPKSSSLFASLGICLLVFDPWVLWSIANDFHTEVFGAAFLVLASRAFFRQRMIAWLWVLCVVLNGNVSTTYLVGLTISLVLAGPKFWKPALGVVSLAGVFTLLASNIGADRGSSFRGYSYLNEITGQPPTSAMEVIKLLVSNPGRALDNIFGYRLALFTTMSVPGLFGVLSPWAFGISLICITEAGFLAWPVLTPAYSFQNFALLIFLPIGTVMVLSDLYTKHKDLIRKILRGIVILQILWTVGWFLVWTPEAPRRWVSIPAESAGVLKETLNRIPQGDQVVASQGVIGSFSARNYLSMIGLDEWKRDIPIYTSNIWFVVTPNLGIELQTPAQAFRMISRLLDLPGISLMTQREGVYVLRWKVPDGFGNELHISYRNQPVNPNLLNTLDGWHSGSPSSQEGYVLSGFYQIVDRPQRFRYSVILKSDGPLVFEAWNLTSNTLLARRNVTSTSNRTANIVIDGRVFKIHGQDIWNGFWPFRSQVEHPYHEGDALELRIFKSGRVKYEINSVNFMTEFKSH